MRLAYSARLVGHSVVWKVPPCRRVCRRALTPRDALSRLCRAVMFADDRCIRALTQARCRKSPAEDARFGAVERRMMNLLMVSVAGALGSASRYLVSLGAYRWLGSAFPYGTLAVNVLGSFLIALIMQVALRGSLISPLVRLTLTTGFLGGFTTYSAFNYESLDMLSKGAWRLAITNLLVTLFGCLFAGALGYRVARALIPA
jgi:fluoride exporter